MHRICSRWLVLPLAIPFAVGAIACASDEAAQTDATDTRVKGAARALESGIDQDNMEKATRAQDDFYAHVSGSWLKRTEIPNDKSNYGAFSELADAAESNIKSIIEDAAAGKVEGKSAKKIGDAYAAFMNEAAIEAKGLAPLLPMQKKIQGLKTKADLAKAMGMLQTHGVSMPLVVYVDQDAKNTTEYIAWLSQSGLGLPDRDYYFDEGEKFDAWRAAYKKYLTDLFVLAGRDAKAAADASKRVYAIEEKLAKGQWTRTESRDRDKTYNKFNSTQLQKTAPKMEWGNFLGGLALHGKGASEVIVRQPTYATAFGEVFDAAPMADWNDYLEARLVTSAAGTLPKAFVDLHFGFYGKTLSGIETNRPRWKRGVSHVESMLGEAIGEVYVGRHFKPEAKARMNALVDNLRSAFKVSINDLEWMGDDTKKKAQVKLAKFSTKIGYPDGWKSYDALEIKNDDALGNLMRSRQVEHSREMSKLGKPIDRAEWFMTPQTVNAYYNPPMNEIVFPAAILQPPFFNLAADDAVNYGAIGAVIGHEFSHGFDDQGRKSDGDGNLTDWWTEADATEFKRRADGLAAQYNGFKPFPDANVNGELTLGENIADLGGITVAFQAWKLSLNGKEAPVLDGLTGEQRFFMGWAQAFRRKYREAELRRRLKTDPHSPSQYRANGPVSNMPDFYAAFGVKEGDKLHRPEAERVKIW